MKKAVQTKNFTELDNAIKTQVEPMLYNKGEGRMIPIAKLVLLRNRDRSRARWVSKKIKNLYILFFCCTIYTNNTCNNCDYYIMAVRKIEDAFHLSHFSSLGMMAYSANRSQYHLHFKLLVRSPGIF